MPNSLVTKAEINGNNDIVLTVKVDAFTDGEYVEVSGYATQNSYETLSYGGFASFNEIREIENPDPAGTVKLTVTAKPTRKFEQGLDVTVAVRVSKVWITVLSKGQTPLARIQTQPAGPHSAWNWVKAVGGPDEYSSDPTSPDQAAAGSSGP